MKKARQSPKDVFRHLLRKTIFRSLKGGYLHHATSQESGGKIENSKRISPRRSTGIAANSHAMPSHSEFIYCAVGEKNLCSYLDSENQTNFNAIWVNGKLSIDTCSKNKFHWNGKLLDKTLVQLSGASSLPQKDAFQKAKGYCSLTMYSFKPGRYVKLDFDEDVIRHLKCKKKLIKAGERNGARFTVGEKKPLGVVANNALMLLIKRTGWKQSNESGVSKSKYNKFVKKFHSNSNEVLRAKIELLKALNKGRGQNLVSACIQQNIVASRKNLLPHIKHEPKGRRH